MSVLSLSFWYSNTISISIACLVQHGICVSIFSCAVEIAEYYQCHVNTVSCVVCAQCSTSSVYNGDINVSVFLSAIVPNVLSVLVNNSEQLRSISRASGEQLQQH